MRAQVFGKYCSEVRKMPKINYDNLPYEKEFSTGEHVGKNAYYRPDPNAEESSEIYRGYYTLDLVGLTIDNVVLRRVSSAQ